MVSRYALPLVALLLVPTAFAQNAADEALAHLIRNANRYGLVATDFNDVVVTDAYASRRSGTTHVYLRQRLNGIEIPSATFTVNVDRNGRVIHTAGGFLPNMAERRVADAPALAPEDAAYALAVEQGLVPTEAFVVVSREANRAQQTMLSEGGIADGPVSAELVYHVDDWGGLHLVWEVGLYERGGRHSWLGRVDALSGRVLHVTDLVVNDEFGPSAEAEVNLAPVHTDAPMSAGAPYAASAASRLIGTYRVYPYPVVSPIYTAPLPPADARVLVANPDDPAASPFGWHDTNGAAGAEFTTTQGNNAHAYTDTNADNNPDPGSAPDGGGGLVFDFPLDLTQPPSAYRPAAVTNLFYWNNIIHDIFYQYGFDEVSGNFQETNYGGVGVDGDYVRAEAQDGSGVNNANFCTPPEGGCNGCSCFPRMQMFLGSNPNPDVDGDLDNHVIVHEYTHGLSNRLTGGPGTTSCLSNAEQMGEGWSDWYGLLLTQDPADTRTTRRPVGNYLFGQPAGGTGIRPAPYTTDFAVNDFTYGDTRSLGGAHDIGFVWSTILWEVSWDVMDAYGFDPNIWDATGTAGNVVMLSLATEAMKMMPCSPGFVDARDAILAADVALYGGLHTDELWSGFARRGLGLGADQGSSSTNSDNTESFVLPENVPPAPVTDLAAAPASLGVELTWTATGDDGTVGTAVAYDIRYATSPILTDAAFGAAMQVQGEPTPAESGTDESFTVTGLDFDATYHFAMKVSDDSFNQSDLSNSAEVTTAGPPDLQVSTAPIVMTVAPGSSGTAHLAIGNAGESDLTFAIDLTETTPTPRQAAPVQESPARTEAPARAASKDAPSPAGPPVLRGRGGPDAFGYSWIDSDEPGGPAYAWTDIAGTGTSVSLSDDGEAPLTLPWSFDFYGTAYTQTTLSSNGTLSFTHTDVTYENDPIPTTDAPNGLVAPFWDDLDPSDGGTIHYQDMGDGRFIVQWTNVPHYSGSGSGDYTFQVVLYQSGQILFQYEEVDGATLDSATIGIENAAGTDGLQVAYNAPYAHDGLAVRISSIWVSADPASGTVAQGASENVALTFDASGLAEGTYTADLTIHTNEPGATPTVVPLVFVVTTLNPPVAVVAPTTFAFEVPRGESREATLTVTNDGEADLHWSLALQGGGDLPEWLAFDALTGVVAGDSQADVTVTATAALLPVGSYAATLVMSTNDPANATITVTVAMDVTAGVSTEAGMDFPGTHLLSAVYPNPFNPAATFSLAVAEAQDVRVELYDALGRRVALLHNGSLAARTSYRFTVDGTALTSGAYFVRITGADFAETRRVMLLK